MDPTIAYRSGLAGSHPSKIPAVQSARSVWEVKPVAGCCHRERRPSPIFLDIEIKGEEKKGLEIAKEIRKKDPHATIVFVTTHSEFMPITFQYKVAALDFIDKRWVRKSSERESAQPSIIPWSKLGPRLRKMLLHLRVRWREYKFPLIRFCMLKRLQLFTRSFYTLRMSAWNFTLVLPISKKQIPACIGATAPLW